VAFETHFSRAVVRDRCFILQGGFQCPLPSFYLAFLVGSKSTRVALSSPSYLSKRATYPVCGLGPISLVDSTWLVSIAFKSVGTALSGSPYLSKQATYPVCDLGSISLLDSIRTSLYKFKNSRTSLPTTTPPMGPSEVTHPCGIQGPLLQDSSECPMLL